MLKRIVVAGLAVGAQAGIASANACGEYDGLAKEYNSLVRVQKADEGEDAEFRCNVARRSLAISKRMKQLAPKASSCRTTYKISSAKDYDGRIALDEVLMLGCGPKGTAVCEKLTEALSDNITKSFDGVGEIDENNKDTESLCAQVNSLRAVASRSTLPSPISKRSARPTTKPATS